MKGFFHGCVMGMALCAGALVTAQDSGNWHLSLGVSWREVKDVDFKGVTFSSPAYSAMDAGGPYVNGRNQSAGIVQVDNTTNQVTGAVASLDRISVPGGNADDESMLGLALDARYLVDPEAGLSIGFALSLTGFDENLGDQQAGNVLTDSFNITGGFNPYIVTSGPKDQVGAGVTTGMLDYDLDLQALCLSGGLVALYRWDALDFVCSVGPTLTYADVDTQTSQVVTWTNTAPDVATQGAVLYSSSTSGSEKDLILGAYGSIGVEMHIMEYWKAGLEARYDVTFANLDTANADIDLGGPSGVLKLIYSF